jgi:hypothetical protein
MVAGQEDNYRLRGFRWYERDDRAENLNGTLPKAPTIPASPPPIEETEK